MKKLTFLLLFMITGVANAGIITVDFEVTFNDGVLRGGTFSGIDANSDNFLTFDELTSFSYLTYFSQVVELTDLDDFGDFNVMTDTWINNALRISPNPADAWFSYYNFSASVRPEIVSSVTASQRAPVPVPVPGTLLLFGFGLAGLGLARRFRASAKV